MVTQTFAILVVEDSKIQASVLSSLFRRSGFEVTICTNGREALQLLREDPLPALVLSDVDMPEMDGYRLCQKIKGDARTRDLPVVLLTSFEDPRNVLYGLQAGADGYLTKPYDPEMLITKVTSILTTGETLPPNPDEQPLTVNLGGDHFSIGAGRQQVLNFLLSTFEGAYRQHQQLREGHQKLSQAYRLLAEKNQELEALVELRNKFMGMVTHDMRSPLGVISGYSKMFVDGTLPLPELKRDKYLRASETISKCAQSLIVLVDELLATSEIEAGKLRLQKAPTDLQALLGQAVELNAFLAEGKNVHIEADFEAVGILSLDRDKIEQVANNLLTNAVKFSQPGTLVKVVLRRQVGGVCWSVIDQGQGIPIEEQDDIFRPFVRSSVRPTAGEKSTGLGLSISKRIIEGHGGTIKVDSQPGRGSRFIVVLPYSLAEVPANTRETSSI